MRHRVVIVGAGIGGLTLAAGLQRAGRPYVVLERAPNLEPPGAGLMLQINAVKALRCLELDERARAIGAEVHTGLGCDARGRRLSELDLAALSRELGAPVVAMHRSRLHALLVEAAGRDFIRTGASVSSYDERDGAVAAVLESGERVAGELLVGADGLRSAVRAKLVGDGDPRYAGYTSWRGVAPVTGICPARTLVEAWGRGLRFGMVEIGGGETYWFAVANAPHRQRDDDARGAVAARFAGFSMRIPELVDATPHERVFRTDIHDRHPIDAFARGRVVLLGDAAHPMTPDLGQGGCLAVEDGVVLAKCLAAGAHEGTLAEYERHRVARARKLVLGSRRLGKMGTMKSALGSWLRNTALRWTPKSVVVKQMRAMLDFEL